MKLYRSATAKPVVFREAAIHAVVEAWGLPVPAVWSVQQIGDRWGIPAADACRSYLLLKLNAEEIAEPYLDAWCRVTDVVRQKVTDWLPHIAAARLSENVPGEFDRLLEIAQS